jgi:hypothetical protein
MRHRVRQCRAGPEGGDPPAIAHRPDGPDAPLSIQESIPNLVNVTVGSVAAGGEITATASTATPQNNAMRPLSSRIRPIRFGLTAASRSASVGRIVPARTAATSIDSTATATPARKATTKAITKPVVNAEHGRL